MHCESNYYSESECGCEAEFESLSLPLNLNMNPNALYLFDSHQLLADVAPIQNVQKQRIIERLRVAHDDAASEQGRRGWFRTLRLTFNVLTL